MNKKVTILLIFVCIFIVSGKIQAKTKDTIGKQLFKNFNLGWDVNSNHDYRWSNFHIGTAYGRKFESDSKAAWQIGADLNWSKYTLFSDGIYSLGTNNNILRTRSLSFPLIASYDISKTFFHGLKVYTGPTYEMIFSSTLNRNDYSKIRFGQFGWTVGTKIRFLAIFSARLAYNYYPTPLFNNGNLNRSNVSFSFGF